MACPMPRVPPVTRAVWPVRSKRDCTDAILDRLTTEGDCLELWRRKEETERINCKTLEFRWNKAGSSTTPADNDPRARSSSAGLPASAFGRWWLSRGIAPKGDPAMMIKCRRKGRPRHFARTTGAVGGFWERRLRVNRVFSIHSLFSSIVLIVTWLIFRTSPHHCSQSKLLGYGYRTNAQPIARRESTNPRIRPPRRKRPTHRKPPTTPHTTPSHNSRRSANSPHPAQPTSKSPSAQPVSAAPTSTTTDTIAMATSSCESPCPSGTNPPVSS
jgi:hypothetical protein